MDVRGKVVLEMSPVPGNPRNSEGAFLALPDGRLMLAYSRFGGKESSDFGPGSIALRYSADGGSTWSEPQVIVTGKEHGAVNVMSASLLDMRNGDIGLFYLVKRGIGDCRLHVRRSADGGRTWGEAVRCIPAPGYYVVNNDRVVRLSSGRIVVPAAHSKAIAEVDADGTPLEGRRGMSTTSGVVYMYLSDDDGRTWRESRGSCFSPAPELSGLQEPGVIELAGGLLYGWCRTRLGRQYQMLSRDGGETWTPAVPSVFTSPNSPLSMKRVPGTGALLAVWNPVPDYQTRAVPNHHGRTSWGRKPLVGALSWDEGAHWGSCFTIEGEENRGGYCYTAIHFGPDAAFLAYCAGEPEDVSCLARLRIRKIPLAEVLDAGGPAPT